MTTTIRAVAASLLAMAVAAAIGGSPPGPEHASTSALDATAVPVAAPAPVAEHGTDGGAPWDPVLRGWRLPTDRTLGTITRGRHLHEGTR